MFSSVFGSDNSSNSKVNFRPVTDVFSGKEVMGALEPSDTEWLCAGGFVTETQVFYSNLEDGTFVLCQVIHSSVGLWSPTIQFTCKIYRPDTKEQTWKSVNVSNFTTPPSPKHDKRSCKADKFSIIHTIDATSGEEKYTIAANPDLQVQINLSVVRTAKGFKFGEGPKGGFSYFGSNEAKPEGYVIHRFWPRTKVSGHVILKGKAIEAKGVGMFVHAIQGMRPNLVAASWNFADFQSKEEEGVSAIQMEFTTIGDYGRKGKGGVVVNIGCVVIDNELAMVTGETKWQDEVEGGGEEGTRKGLISRAEHIEPTFDPDTAYKQPRRIKYEWRNSEAGREAELEVDVGGPEKPIGLLEKVDVLGEIPLLIRKFVNYVAGTKPYIYQWLNETELVIRTGSEERRVRGALYNEATFISK